MQANDGLEGCSIRKRGTLGREMPHWHAQFKTCYDTGGISPTLALALEWMDGSFVPIGRILHMCGMLMLRSRNGPNVEMDTERLHLDDHGEHQREQVTLWAWSLDRVPESPFKQFSVRLDRRKCRVLPARIEHIARLPVGVCM